MSANQQTALAAYREMALKPKRLEKDDFTLSNGEAGSRTKVASYTAPNPLEIRNQPFRLMMAYHEGFYHDGATTAEQTYNLTLDAIDTENTTSVEVYAGTWLTEVASAPADDEFSVDYSADTVTIDVDTDETAHVFYYAANGLTLEIVKEKPGTTGTVAETLYDDITSDLFQRNQHQTPPVFDLTDSAYQPVIPRDWELAVYVDGSSYGIDWDDSDTDTSGSMTVAGVSPVGPIIDIPIRMAPGNVAGLSREVAMDIGGRR